MVELSMNNWNKSSCYIIDFRSRTCIIISLLFFSRIERIVSMIDDQRARLITNAIPIRVIDRRNEHACCTLDPDGITSESVHYGNAWFFIRSNIDVFFFFSF